MYKVLLLCYTNWETLSEIPAVLKKGGCTVDVFCSRGSWAKTNRYYNKWIESAKEPDAYISQLIDYIAGEHYDWIIPGDDSMVRLLNEAIQTEDLFYKLLPLTKIENRDLLGKKSGLSNLCAKYAIKTPRYLIYEKGFDYHTIGEKLDFPILIKLDESNAGLGVFLCENEKEVITKLAAIEDKQNIVFQEYIKGHNINLEVLYKNGELIVYNYATVLKTLSHEFGISTERLYHNNEEIEPELVKIGRRMALNGFGNIAFIYDEAKQMHYLIEIDMRPNSWIYYGKYCGNDFSKGVAKIIKGDLTLLKTGNKGKSSATKVTLFKKDLSRCMVDKDYKGMLHWMLNKDNRWRYIPMYDYKVFSASVIGLFREFKMLRSTRRGVDNAS